MDPRRLCWGADATHRTLPAPSRLRDRPLRRLPVISTAMPCSSCRIRSPTSRAASHHHRSFVARPGAPGRRHSRRQCPAMRLLHSGMTWRRRPDRPQRQPERGPIDAAITNICAAHIPRCANRFAARSVSRPDARRVRGTAPGISPEDAAREVPALASPPTRSPRVS